jgi:hypothetical protein
MRVNYQTIESENDALKAVAPNCPPSADPQGYKNWIRNVRFFLYAGV